MLIKVYYVPQVMSISDVNLKRVEAEDMNGQSPPTYEQLEAENRELKRVLEKAKEIVTNKGQSYAYRVIDLDLLFNHPKEILEGEEFKIDVGKEQKNVGVGSDCMAKYFVAKSEAGGCKYISTPIRQENEGGSVSYTRESIFKAIPETFANSNTKIVDVTAKQRDAENTRRKARIEAANHPVCPSCGSSEHIHTVLTPVCMKCEIAIEEQRQLVKTEAVRIEIAEETVSENTTSEEAASVSPDTDPVENFTTTTDEPDHIKEFYQDDYPLVEPDDMQEAYELPMISDPVHSSNASSQATLFPDLQRKQAVPVAVIDGSILPNRACFKCGVQDWQWDPVLEIAICGNCG